MIPLGSLLGPLAHFPRMCMRVGGVWVVTSRPQNHLSPRDPPTNSAALMVEPMRLAKKYLLPSRSGERSVARSTLHTMNTFIIRWPRLKRHFTIPRRSVERRGVLVSVASCQLRCSLPSSYATPISF